MNFAKLELFIASRSGNWGESKRCRNAICATMRRNRKKRHGKAQQAQ